jgi:hypothetical protein
MSERPIVYADLTQRLYARVAELERERDELRDVIELLIIDEWGYREPAAPDVQDLLTERGILVEAPAPERYREEWDSPTWYVLRWFDAARGESEPTP